MILKLLQGELYGDLNNEIYMVDRSNVVVYNGQFSWSFDIVEGDKSKWYSFTIPNEANFNWLGHYEKVFMIQTGRLGPLRSDIPLWRLSVDSIPEELIWNEMGSLIYGGDFKWYASNLKKLTDNFTIKRKMKVQS